MSKINPEQLEAEIQVTIREAAARTGASVRFVPNEGEEGRGWCGWTACYRLNAREVRFSEWAGVAGWGLAAFVCGLLLGCALFRVEISIWWFHASSLASFLLAVALVGSGRLFPPADWTKIQADVKQLLRERCNVDAEQCGENLQFHYPANWRELGCDEEDEE